MLKQNLLVTVSAIALLTAFSTAGLSQSPRGGSSGGAQEQQRVSPGTGDSNRGGGADERTAPNAERKAQRNAEPMPKASDRAEEKASPKSRVQNRDANPKASERAQEKASPKSASQAERDDDRGRGPRNADGRNDDTRKKSDRARAKDRDHADENASKEKRGDRAERRGAKDAPKQSQAPAKDRTHAAGDSRKDGRADRQRNERAEGERNPSERVRLTEQKRTTIREHLSKSARSNRVTNVNFDIRVGARVPRGTALHVLPPDVVQIAPAYRDYRYVYVRDEIVIIDPKDYVVVAVIGGDSRVTARSDSHRITLTPADHVFIRQHVDLDTRVPLLGIGSFTIGMDLPDTVELRPLPEVVVERYPDLTGYRYLVYEDDVLIVEPDSRGVAFVIDDR
jgi:hypothetical protein